MKLIVLIILFYNEYLANKYIEMYKNTIKQIKYYKGLGTSEKKDIEQSFGKFIELLIYDKNTDNMLDIMFNNKKNFSDYRKKLIETYKNNLTYDDLLYNFIKLL